MFGKFIKENHLYSFLVAFGAIMFSMIPLQYYLNIDSKFIGTALTSYGIILIISQITVMIYVYFRRPNNSKDFVNTYNISKAESVDEIKKTILCEIEKLHNKTITKDDVNNIVYDTIAKQITLRTDRISKSFSSYFINISSFLEDKIVSTEENANSLLRTGKTFAFGGILFYISSIVAWQLLSNDQDDFKAKHIYGIISCSFLFIFIECISAWFLKQYRYFIDTSTFITKTKTILDRYMLTFLLKEEFKEPEYVSKHLDHLQKILSEQITWPENNSLTKESHSFLVEAMEQMSTMAKIITKQKQAD